MEKMEQVLQKKNTDCVYFLASPLTCKKGIECEYRHSEIARLNPRDCWYWLAGSCVNPTCAFRHPPLDGRTETASESASADHQSAITVNKTNVPCYYYYNGFCSKGERCSFMHGPEENTYTWRSSKQSSAIADGPPLEEKISTGTGCGPVPAETHSARTDPKSLAGTKVIPQRESRQFTPNNVAEHCQPAPNDAAEKSVYPQISVSSSEEAATIRSNFQIHTEGLVHRRSLESTDQSFDDEFDNHNRQEVDNHIEREEWLESSPGFDVLVNDRSEDLGYEDEALYLPHRDMEDRECNGQHLAYEYEDNIEYDPAYPDIRTSFEQGIPNWYQHVEEDVCNMYQKTPFYARERVLDHPLPRKRKLLQTELAGMDLRDYLKKRRMPESQDTKYLSDRPHFSHLTGKIIEKASTGGRGHLPGRLASKVEFADKSRIETENCSSSTYQHGRTRRPSINRSRLHTKERKQGKGQIVSGVPRKAVPRKRKSARESTVFTGPKTLAQIKEEKEKALCGRTGEGHLSGDA
ncbi:zinc finger CCCH domain-containing protein 32-like [Coffea eugenioides]|uniref:Zinc finger CCCH domain-containing protein 34-like n=1 Tax=Coffea arabica TaxID=13443 RepID=A0A6P6STJ3_COFAR|nr:zinc finger CCCH domain-containing protein 32-like [Coffea arabica]XP_027176930.1 zinc finger CCCH domain-containing protein 32-like [Coffea eugenioides]